MYLNIFLNDFYLSESLRYFNSYFRSQIEDEFNKSGIIKIGRVGFELVLYEDIIYLLIFLPYIA